MTLRDRRAARQARCDSRAQEADRLRRGYPSEPRMRYRCEFHRPKLYRYRVARVDTYGPLPWFRWPSWNAYRSPHGTARIGASVVFGDWCYAVKWGRLLPLYLSGAAEGSARGAISVVAPPCDHSGPWDLDPDEVCDPPCGQAHEWCRSCGRPMKPPCPEIEADDTPDLPARF